MAEDGFAVTAYREDGGVWQCGLLPESVLNDLDIAVATVRSQPGEGGAIVLVDIDDEFFVALRSGRPGDVRMLLSDVTAAADYEIARQAVRYLGEETPDDDELDEVWPVGDLAIFADLGLDEMELRAILDDLDLYADEMIAAIAGRVGFADAYAQVVDALPR
jgi:putative tRNA adenosine deaminase-associated protein